MIVIRRQVLTDHRTESTSFKLMILTHTLQTVDSAPGPFCLISRYVGWMLLDGCCMLHVACCMLDVGRWIVWVDARRCIDVWVDA